MQGITSLIMVSKDQTPHCSVCVKLQQRFTSISVLMIPWRCILREEKIKGVQGCHALTQSCWLLGVLQLLPWSLSKHSSQNSCKINERSGKRLPAALSCSISGRCPAEAQSHVREPAGKSQPASNAPRDLERPRARGRSIVPRAAEVKRKNAW